jgi:hypothetical protein
MTPKRQPRTAANRQPRKLPKPSTKGVTLFSEHEREIYLSQNDHVGFEYLKARRIRKRQHPTPEHLQFLAKHDRVEASIRSGPRRVLTKAYQDIDQGVESLLRLIHSGELRDAVGDSAWDDAVECLASRLRFMNDQLVRLAEMRAPHAASHLWSEAKQLTEAVVRLAVAYPDDFRSSAESSLTMPSLRACNPNFTCDAIAIAEAIHLAEKHPAPDIRDNRSRLGALCHHLVAHIVDAIESARRQKHHLERTARHAKSDKVIPAFYHPSVRRHYQACWGLPDLRGKADQWWNGRVKDMLEEEFARMSQRPTHNPALWQELARATDGGTGSAKWRVLEKNCRNKLQQIAGKDTPQP